MLSVKLLCFLLLLLSACEQNSDPHTAFDQGDYETAYRSFLILAKEDDLEAQNYLGVMHYLGLGRKRNLNEAKEWFEQAAVKGHPGAQYNLGNMYENGEGVERDFILSYMWFYAAKEQGHVKAEARMALLLEDHKLFSNQAEVATEQAKQYIFNR